VGAAGRLVVPRLCTIAPHAVTVVPTLRMEILFLHGIATAAVDFTQAINGFVRSEETLS
jgi:hypothetical protein